MLRQAQNQTIAVQLQLGPPPQHHAANRAFNWARSGAIRNRAIGAICTPDRPAVLRHGRAPRLRRRVYLWQWFSDRSGTRPQMDTSFAKRSARADGLSSPISSPAFHLRAGTGNLCFGHVFRPRVSARPWSASARSATLIGPGACIDGNHAGIGIGTPTVRTRCSTARVSSRRRLEQPRGHGPAQRARKHLRGVEICVAIGRRLPARR